METDDTLTELWIKIWPWIQANRNRLIAGAGVIVAVVLIFSYFSYQKNQQELAASDALTSLMLSISSTASDVQLAQGYQKILTDYPNTKAGWRAQLGAATALFEANQFTDAQAQFQKYLDDHPDGAFAATATLGVASCLEAQGKLDQAAGLYQRVANGFSDFAAGITAKLSLARVDEAQGKFGDAMNLYADIEKLMPGSAASSDAALRALELRTKIESAKPAGTKS